MHVSYTDVDGLRTRFYHAGKDGDPLVLIHGYGLSSDLWINVIDPLADAGFVVYAPDLLGHGFTAFRDFEGEPPQIALVGHLGRFLDRMNIVRCGLIGSSLGGILAPLLYLSRPSAVSDLVLVGTDTAISETGTVEPEIILAAMANGTKAMTNPTLESCIARLANITHKEPGFARDIALVQLSTYGQDDRLMAYRRIGEGIASAANDERVRIKPQKIEVPTLFLCGRQDIRVSVTVILENFRRVACAEVAVFEECGHLPEIEHPTRFVEAVLGFLNRHRGTRTEPLAASGP